jgi:hypothetical protein
VNCFDAGRNLGVSPGRPHDHDDARVHARGANVDIVARLIAEQLGKPRIHADRVQLQQVMLNL